MADSEMVNVLKEIKEKLDEISFDLKDIKRSMPKVPYYGDMLEDIEQAIKEQKR